MKAPLWFALRVASAPLAAAHTSRLAAQAPLRFVSVSAGAGHSCALASEGVAYCWGGNPVGQLGSDSAQEHCATLGRPYPCSPTPLRVKGAQRFTSLSLGAAVTCGLVVSGAVYCWGDRTFGPVGDTALATWTTPVMVADTPTFVSLSAGSGVFCGVTASGAAYCAGRKDLLGTGQPVTAFTAFDRERQPVPVSGGLAFSTIGIGNAFACGLAHDGRTYCWGMDLGWGVLGRRGAQSSSPLLIADAPRFQSLSVGEYHICGLTPDGTAFCWGGGTHGQLGNGSAESNPRPVRVDAPLVFRSISAGSSHTCAVTADGVAYCWGSNDSGQLGNPNTHDNCSEGVCSRRPQAVAGDLRFTGISAGASHTCGVTTSGVVYCWGSNDDGQLGVPRGRKQCGFGQDAEPCSLTPVRVSDPRQ